MRIGVFDSGLGGLRVLKELINRYPNNEYIYFGDTKNIPYGNKTKEQLINYTQKIVEFLESKKVDIIIIACGTGSATIYDELKNKYRTPIIDILSPTITYILSSGHSKIGLIGTERLIESKYFDVHLRNVEVVSVATPDLVPLIESGQASSEECQNILKEYLKPFDNIPLVLGCTHYPLLKEQILNIKQLQLLDMGIILSQYITLKNDGKFKLELYFSKVDEILKNNVKQLFPTNVLNKKEL